MGKAIWQLLTGLVMLVGGMLIAYGAYSSEQPMVNLVIGGFFWIIGGALTGRGIVNRAFEKVHVKRRVGIGMRK